MLNKIDFNIPVLYTSTKYIANMEDVKIINMRRTESINLDIISHLNNYVITCIIIKLSLFLNYYYFRFGKHSGCSAIPSNRLLVQDEEQKAPNPTPLTQAVQLHAGAKTTDTSDGTHTIPASPVIVPPKRTHPFSHQL